MHLAGKRRFSRYFWRSRRATNVVLEGDLVPAGTVLVTPVLSVVELTTGNGNNAERASAK